MKHRWRCTSVMHLRHSFDRRRTKGRCLHNWSHFFGQVLANKLTLLLLDHLTLLEDFLQHLKWDPMQFQHCFNRFWSNQNLADTQTGPMVYSSGTRQWPSFLSKTSRPAGSKRPEMFFNP